MTAVLQAIDSVTTWGWFQSVWFLPDNALLWWCKAIVSWFATIFIRVAQWMLRSVPVFWAFVGDRKLIRLQQCSLQSVYLHMVMFVCLLVVVFMVFLLLLWLFLADNKHLEICIYYTYQHIIWYFCTVCTCIHLDSIQIGPEQVSRSRNLQTMSGPAQIMYEPAVCQQCQNLCKFPENRHAFFCRWIFVKPAQTVFTWGDNRVWREANQHLSLEVCNLCQNSHWAM